jgi:hypothetical protein
MSASSSQQPGGPHLGHLLVLTAILVAACALGSNTAACTAAAAIIALAPFVSRPTLGRSRFECVLIAEPFTLAIAIFALRSVLGPPSWWLTTIVVLVTTLICGWVARVRLRTGALPQMRLGVYLPMMAATVALLPVGWIVGQGHPAIGQGSAWDSLERVHVNGPWDPPQQGSPKCGGRCAYILEGNGCLTVQTDIEPCWVVDCPSTETCPLIDVRRAPGSRALVATRSQQQGPDGWRSPSPPHVITKGKSSQVFEFGAQASPFAMGATAPPPSWRWTALAGVVVCAAQLLWFARLRRRVAQMPPEGPYRAPPEQSGPPADLSVSLRHARLVLLATALPVLIALAATLARMG